MLRNILGVIGGYVALAVFLGLAFTVLYLVLGTDGSYKPDSWEVSGLWVGLTIPIGIMAALLGGWVCRLISKKRGAVTALAVVVLALGIGEAAYQFSREAPTRARPADIPVFEAASESRQPRWVAIANPIIGVVGVLLGGGALGGRKSNNPGD